MDQWEDSVVLVLEGLQLEVLAGLALWEQCILVLLEEVLLVAIDLQEDLVLDVWDLAVLELDVLDWEALLEPADLWEQSTQLLLEEVLSGVVLWEELDMVDLLEVWDMVDLLEESDMVDLLEESDMEELWVLDLWLALVLLPALWELPEWEVVRSPTSPCTSLCRARTGGSPSPRPLGPLSLLSLITPAPPMELDPTG